MSSRKVVFGAAVDEFLAGLGGDEEPLPPAAEHLAKPLFCAAVGRRRVEEIDAVRQSDIEQRLALAVARQCKPIARRILSLPVAAELDGAETERAHRWPADAGGRAV